MRSHIRARLAILATSLFAVSMVVPAVADDVVQVYPQTPAPVFEDGAAVDETPDTWFVELSSPPLADGGSLSSTRADKTTFRTNARNAGLNYRERFAFDDLWNGLSIKIDRSQLAALSRINGVKALWPVLTATVPDEIVPGAVADLASAITMTGADIVQNDLGYTGKGVKVGVIDTGIDYEHPDLGAGFGPGKRVAVGYDFVGDNYDAATNPNPVPDPDPKDCAGHGTHVAGIIGAKAAEAGGVTGVAPEVTFGAYRVFGCSGSTSADVMIAAMERALADGMQVVNMSIGSAFTWPQYPTAAASDRLVNKGVVVVASIGNSGENGLYSGGAPGVGSKVIGVASFDNLYATQPSFTVSGISRNIGYSPATGAPNPPTTGTYPMARTGTTTSTADACDALPAGSLAGKAVLVRRGTCSFYIKAMNAQIAGAASVVIYNNAPGFISATVAPPAGSPPGTPLVTIPVVTVISTDGAIINAQVAAGATTLTWTDQKASVAVSTGGLISSFSSYGLAPDLSLKPDLGAPGGLIYSTYPLALGGYASLSGTSMSSPHVAGAVALLLQAKPHTPANAVRDILQNAAVPKNWWGQPGLGFLDNVQRQGAGMLRIDRAIEATTRVTPAKLALGESQAGSATRTLTIANASSASVTYTLSDVPALATGPNTFNPSFLTAFAAVAFTVPSVTIAAGASASVDVTITAPSSPDRGLYGGYLVATGSDGSVTRVPYAGFIGDYQSIQVLKPTANGFPWLAQIVGASYVKVTASATFTLVDGDVPVFLMHLDHQSRLMKIEIFDASGKAWHTAFQEPYLVRNTTSTGFFGIPWDGSTSAGNRTYTVPNGTYHAQLSVLKALGDAANPADWETWTSPTFTIARP